MLRTRIVTAVFLFSAFFLDLFNFFSPDESFDSAFAIFFSPEVICFLADTNFASFVMCDAASI